MVGGSLTIPFILFPKLCIEEDDPVRGYIISTVFFISGLITLMQTTFGVRLPIVQGGSFAYLVPILAILKLPENQCPADFAQNGWGNMTYEDKTEEWQKRMRVIQGSVAVASVFQVIVGYFGRVETISFDEICSQTQQVTFTFRHCWHHSSLPHASYYCASCVHDWTIPLPRRIGHGREELGGVHWVWNRERSSVRPKEIFCRNTETEKSSWKLPKIGLNRNFGRKWLV